MTFDFNWPQNIEVSETNKTKVVYEEIIIFNFLFWFTATNWLSWQKGEFLTSRYRKVYFLRSLKYKKVDYYHLKAVIKIVLLK